jgi:hypothetical protein
MRIIHLGGVTKDRHWMRNKEQYAHTLSCSCRFRIRPLTNEHQPSSSFLEDASILNPKWLDWTGRGRCPGWRGTGLCSKWFHMGQAGQSSTVHQLLLHSTLNTTAHLTDWSGPRTPDFFPVRHSTIWIIDILKNLKISKGTANILHWQFHTSMLVPTVTEKVLWYAQQPQLTSNLDSHIKCCCPTGKRKASHHAAAIVRDYRLTDKELESLRCPPPPVRDESWKAIQTI